MAYPFGGRGGDGAFPEQESIAFSAAALPADIKRQFSSLIPLGRPQRRLLLGQHIRPLLAACGEALEELAEAEDDDAQLREQTKKRPVTGHAYSDVIFSKAAGKPLPVIAPVMAGADTPEEYATACRREGGPVAGHVIKLAVCLVVGTGIAIIEISVLHAILSLRFPPVIGAPEQALGQGPVIAIFGIVVLAGYFAFRDCGERLQTVLRAIGRLATIPFLIGMGLFGAGSVIAGLSGVDVPAPTGFTDLPEAVTVGLFSVVGDMLTGIGDIGFAVALLVTPVLSFFALENCLRGMCEAGKHLIHSLHLRREAAKTMRRARRASKARTRAARNLKYAKAELADAPAEVANHIVSMSMPFAVAAESLLVQRELTADAGADFEPDQLSAHVMAMDCTMLRKRLDAFQTALDASAIEKDLRKSMKALTRSKGE